LSRAGSGGGAVNVHKSKQDLKIYSARGEGFDPCCALQTVLELEPGQCASIAFILGRAADRATARALLRRHRAVDVDAALAEVMRKLGRDMSRESIWHPGQTS
jgi:cellobiose phosphorylase